MGSQTIQETIAITATFTAELIEESLLFWMRQLQIPSKIFFAPYNQLFQQLLDPTSLLNTNQNGINVVLLRLEDWGGVSPGPQAVKRINYRDIERNVSDLVHALKAVSERSTTSHLLCLCPASPSKAPDPGRVSFYREMEEFVVSELADVPGMYVLRESEMAVTYPVAHYYDQHADLVGHIPYTQLFFTALGTMIARKIYALKNPPYKAIVLDCDQTLWSGVCGEDGPLGIQFDRAREALQKFMVRQHDAGMLLCVCSKNNEEDVAEVFKFHPEMPLRRDHVAAWRVNWRPKSENIKALAEELQLGLDSFIFIDDNPVECAEVQANCPQVLTIRLPQTADAIPRFLEHVWVFDHLKITEEDNKRTLLYRQHQEREEFRKEFLNFREFLSGLELEIQISSLSGHQLSRVAELTQRTNQFNVSMIRRSEAELQKVCNSEGACLVVQVKDRFGDYGLVGVIIFHENAEALVVDTFLLSCRAMGKGVEHRMLATLGEIAKGRGLDRVKVLLIPARKNRPAQDFLNGIGEQFRESSQDGSIFNFPAEFISKLQYSPPVLRQMGGSSPEHRIAAIPALDFTPGSQAKALLWTSIATELDDAERILKRIREQKRRRRTLGSAVGPVQTAIEEMLAKIWCDVLGIDQVGINDNFFELGGDSLSATMLGSRVREVFNVELHLSKFFNTPTLASLLGEIDRLSETEDQTRLEEESRYHYPDDPLSSGRSQSNQIRPLDKANPSADVKITSIGLFTCNRLNGLKRALSSYIQNARKYERTPEFVVMDDSSGVETRNAYREMVRSLKMGVGASISYVGLEEKERFAARLVEGGLPPDVVQFALFDVERCGYSYGANRNAFLLHTLGEAVFSADDDTACRIAAAPDFESGVGLGSEGDPRELWFFPDRQTVLRSIAFVEKDVLGMHEEILGKDIAGIMGGARPAAATTLHQVDSSLARGLENWSRVAVTLNGLVGDCGWGAPFGYWGMPFGYLLLDGDSHGRLVRSESDYHSACSSREVLKTVKRITVSDGNYCGGPFLGLDNRTGLPPFMPVKRGQDIIWGIALWRCFDNVCFAHLPWALLHAPVEARKFSSGEMFRSAAGCDTAKLMIACLKAFEPGSGRAVGDERLRALGSYLMELGSLPSREFGEFARAQTERDNNSFISMMEERLRLSGESPVFWANDLKRYLDLLQRALKREDYWVPLDLMNGSGISEARELSQRLVLKFGKLLHSWPDIIEVAKSLRGRGHRLADHV